MSAAMSTERSPVATGAVPAVTEREIDAVRVALALDPIDSFARIGSGFGDRATAAPLGVDGWAHVIATSPSAIVIADRPTAIARHVDALNSCAAPDHEIPVVTIGWRAPTWLQDQLVEVEDLRVHVHRPFAPGRRVTFALTSVVVAAPVEKLCLIEINGCVAHTHIAQPRARISGDAADIGVVFTSLDPVHAGQTLPIDLTITRSNASPDRVYRGMLELCDGEHVLSSVPLLVVSIEPSMDPFHVEKRRAVVMFERAARLVDEGTWEDSVFVHMTRIACRRMRRVMRLRRLVDRMRSS